MSSQGKLSVVDLDCYYLVSILSGCAQEHKLAESFCRGKWKFQNGMLLLTKWVQEIGGLMRLKHSHHAEGKWYALQCKRRGYYHK